MQLLALTPIIALAAAQGAHVPTSGSSSNSTTLPAKFLGISIHSGSPLQYLQVNASSNSIWLGHKTTTSCPRSSHAASNTSSLALGLNSTLSSGCSTTAATVFRPGQNGTLNLDASVTGGQQVYVASDGRLRFTTPHSGSRLEHIFPREARRHHGGKHNEMVHHMNGTSAGRSGKARAYGSRLIGSKAVTGRNGTVAAGGNTGPFGISAGGLTFEGKDFWACPEGAKGSYAVYAGQGRGNCTEFKWRVEETKLSGGYEYV